MKRLAGLVVGILLTVGLAVAAAQGPSPAAIQQALRAFLQTANTWTALQTFSAGVNISGGCVGCATPTAPGADTQIIFNAGGAFGADAGLTFTPASDLVTLTQADGTSGGLVIANTAGGVSARQYVANGGDYRIVATPGTYQDFGAFNVYGDTNEFGMYVTGPSYWVRLKATGSNEFLSSDLLIATEDDLTETFNNSIRSGTTAGAASDYTADSLTANIGHAIPFALGYTENVINTAAQASGQVIGASHLVTSNANVNQMWGNLQYVRLTNAAVAGVETLGNIISMEFQGTSSAANSFGSYITTSKAAGASVGNFTSYWSAANGGLATNTYSFWSDEQGVFRIRSDNTFNSVYQAIPALYNPQFTKYTPGAANFERCIPACQWNSNVAEIGNEVGGGGGNVLRDLRFIGQDIKPNPTGFFYLHEAAVTAAPASGACDAAGETNRVVYDSTNDDLYVCSGASGWRKITTGAP